MQGFIDFIKEQGIMGLTLGFILGGSISKVVTSLVEDIVQPILGLILRAGKGLEALIIPIGASNIRLGNFLSILLNFFIVALIVYIIFKYLKLNTIEKKIKL